MEQKTKKGERFKFLLSKHFCLFDTAINLTALSSQDKQLWLVPSILIPLFQLSSSPFSQSSTEPRQEIDKIAENLITIYMNVFVAEYVAHSKSPSHK